MFHSCSANSEEGELRKDTHNVTNAVARKEEI